MSTRQPWMSGLAALLGLALATPVLAAPDFREGEWIVARRDRADEIRPQPRDERRDERRATRRDQQVEPQGYGYGYERRQQQQRSDEESARPRGRR